MALQFLKGRLVLILILACFIFFKLPHLSYPFYWDESWSYAPGLQLMYQHGPSLMPNAIDTFYSRGHPLLFYASIASWMRLFGSGHFSMHCFSLTISLATLVAVFEVGKRLFNLRVATIATVFLAIQVVFFVQASMCLPEIMVALFVLLSLYFYVERNYWALYSSLTALLLTKESSIVLALILAVAVIIQLFDQKIRLKERLRLMLTVALAGATIVAFFVLQKVLNGWFLFPEHTGLIDLGFHSFWGKFTVSLAFLFAGDQRSWIFFGLAALSVIGFIKRKNVLTIPLVLTTLFLWAQISRKFDGLPAKLLLAGIIGLFLYLIAGMIMAGKRAAISGKQVAFHMLAGGFFLLYLVFSGINFFTIRYLLCLFPLLALWIGFFVDYYLEPWAGNYGWLVAPAAILLIGFYAFKTDETWGDVHMRAYNAMAVQETAIRYLEKHHYHNKAIGAGSFQAREHLTKPLTGMLHAADTFTNVRWDINEKTDLALFDNIESDYRYSQIKADKGFYRLVRIENGPIWSEIYGRKSTKNQLAGK